MKETSDPNNSYDALLEDYNGVKEAPETKEAACGYKGCNNPQLAYGLCAEHFPDWETLCTINLGRMVDYNSSFQSALDAMTKIREKKILCSVPGCDSGSAARGLCQKHYWRLTRMRKEKGEESPDPPSDKELEELYQLDLKPPKPVICIVPGCTCKVKRNNMCTKHARSWDEYCTDRWGELREFTEDWSFALASLEARNMFDNIERYISLVSDAKRERLQEFIINRVARHCQSWRDDPKKPTT